MTNEQIQMSIFLTGIIFMVIVYIIMIPDDKRDKNERIKK